MSKIAINPYRVIPVIPISKNRIVKRDEPSEQEKHLQAWTKVRKRDRRVQTTPNLETDEEILIQDLEWAMNCIGMFAVVLVIALIMAIVAYWYTAWIVPAALSLAGLIWIGFKWKEWWNE